MQPRANQITGFKCIIKTALTNKLSSGESGGQYLKLKCKLFAIRLTNRK